MIRVAVDPTNPGQFFACCGLLELADRLWPPAEGWFEERKFCLRTTTTSEKTTLGNLIDQLANCFLTNTMTAQQKARFEELSTMTVNARRTAGCEDERAALEKLMREAPILLDTPFNLQLNWFLDDLAGGSRFKTWAGRQSVLDIAVAMKTAFAALNWQTGRSEECLSRTGSGCGLPFNFDSDLGGQGSALDVGFAFDPLASSARTRIKASVRPCLELLAFIGLQRFRPRQFNRDQFLYCAWNRPLTPEIAAPAACGILPLIDAPAFEFRLLERTKYLKSFLPAIPFFGGSDE